MKKGAYISLLTFFLVFLNIAVACQDSGDDEADWSTTITTLANFSDNGDGTVTQGTLVWMKCAQGQVWDGSLNTCTGTGSGTTYGAVSLGYCEQATLDASGTCTDGGTLESNSGPAYSSCNGLTFAGSSNWRLPTKYELDLLAEGFNRETFLYVFPQTPDDKYFWTGTQVEDDTATAYTVSFAKSTFGNVQSTSKTSPKYVRCVR
ncbi:MAG: DUF1566 domain-containing protein [Leptospiraceae bacterium]|nr:DUF1566 domain-containing protein [Leptospiraceae bacterium]